jgi:hypothetical protein
MPVFLFGRILRFNAAAIPSRPVSQGPSTHSEIIRNLAASVRRNRFRRKTKRPADVGGARDVSESDLQRASTVAARSNLPWLASSSSRERVLFD